MFNYYKNLEKKYQFVRLILLGCYYILIQKLSIDIADNQGMSFLFRFMSDICFDE